MSHDCPDCRLAIARAEAAESQMRTLGQDVERAMIENATQYTLRAKAESRAAALAEALEEVARLPDAYATDIFPEPDLKRAHEVLVAAGMTLDAISARAGREFTGIAARIARAALAGNGTGEGT